MPDQFMLYYGEIHVANLRSVTYSDRTWQALFEQVLAGNGPTEQRLRTFIATVVDWHSRCVTDRSNPPPMSDFDPFQDLIKSELWQVKLPDGSGVTRLNGAPVLFPKNIISWKCR